MMKLGFQLTGTSKRQKLVVASSDRSALTGEAKVSNDDNNDDDDEFTRVDMIKSIEEHNIHSLEPVVEKKPLVIPLISARSYDSKDDGPGVHGSQQNLLGGVTAHSSSSSTVRVKHEAIVDDSNGVSTSAAIDSVKLEDLATLELLQELKTEGNGDSLYSRSNLVIKSKATTTTHTDDDSAHGGSHGGGGTAKRKPPLLMLHVAPELLQIRDETERFRYDMSHRAEDLSIRSEAYEQVPIEEFGAALLRGMGWKEEEEVDATATAASRRSSSSKKGIDDGNSNSNSRIMPRERNLGLGAMPKPPALSGSHGHSKGKDKDRDRRKEALDNQWRHKVSERITNQRVAEGDVVWVTAGVGTSSSSASSLVGQRGVVVAATGVAGLDRIR